MKVEFREIESEIAKAFQQTHKADFFPGDLIADVMELLTDDEKQRYENIDSHYQGGLTLHFGAFVDNQLVGVHFGRQFERGNYHMGFSAVVKKYQRKGVYTQLLQFVLGEVGKLGFQTVSSRHNASHNAVIIPKLKAGFLIGGFEINEVVGLQVRLVYYFNETRRSLHDFRTGRMAVSRKASQFLPDLVQKS